MGQNRLGGARTGQGPALPGQVVPRRWPASHATPGQQGSRVKHAEAPAFPGLAPGHLHTPATLPTSSLTVHPDVASTNVCDLEQIT